MKINLFENICFSLFVFFLWGCGLKNEAPSEMPKTDSFVKISAYKPITGNDILLDSVGTLIDSLEKNPAYINNRIKSFTKTTLNKWCKDAGFENFPDYIVFRIFKNEAEFEIWGGNKLTDTLKLIKILDICALQCKPGPKLIQGDCFSAEGFYTCGIYYTSPSDYMFIKLTNDEYDNYGVLNYGSCFKIMVNYPNEYDRYNSVKLYSQVRNFGTTAIHGNCCSLGCISFENNLYLVVFAFALLHNTAKYQQIQVQMYPCRFNQANILRIYNENKQRIPMDSLEIFKFWTNLRNGYNLFESNHKPIRFKVTKNGYLFQNFEK